MVAALIPQFALLHKLPLKQALAGVMTMDVCQEIRELTKKYPTADLKEESYGLSVTPEGGFTVWIASNEEYYSVGFEGLDKNFYSSKEALEYFIWCLSSDCRLKVYSKDSKPYKWIARSFKKGQWVNISSVSSLYFDFWKKSSISYMQNSMVFS